MKYELACILYICSELMNYRYVIYERLHMNFLEQKKNEKKIYFVSVDVQIKRDSKL